MTPAASVSFFKPEFDNFLHASITVDRNGMPLSVLSALARLNLHPWQEAAELSDLPKRNATQRLSSLISRLPGRVWTQADSGAIAVRLIELLPPGSTAGQPSAENAQSLQKMSASAVVKMLLCASLAATAVIIAATREPSPPGDHADAPAFSTTSAPQTSPPRSR